MRENFGFLMPGDATGQATAAATASAQTIAMPQQVHECARLAARALQAKQYPQGHWCGDLTADSTLQSDYILLQMWLYPAAADGSWNPPTMGKIRKALKSIRDAQRDDGGQAERLALPQQAEAEPEILEKGVHKKA
jgi:hypothetical protein